MVHIHTYIHTYTLTTSTSPAHPSSPPQARLQQQTNNLENQLREERRQRLEETVQLRRQTHSLATQLQQKEEQLQKYRSTPSLSSWGVKGGMTGDWNTSLPDVRVDEEPPGLVSSVPERRKSFSGAGDAAGERHSPGLGSHTRKAFRVMDDCFEASYVAPVKSYESVESYKISHKPHVRLGQGGPVTPTLSGHVWSGVAGEASRKSDRAAGKAGRRETPPVKDDRQGGALEGEEGGKARMKTTLYVQLQDYTKARGAGKGGARGMEGGG